MSRRKLRNFEICAWHIHPNFFFEFQSPHFLPRAFSSKNLISDSFKEKIMTAMLQSAVLLRFRFLPHHVKPMIASLAYYQQLR